jgi:hypothetical protein
VEGTLEARKEPKSQEEMRLFSFLFCRQKVRTFKLAKTLKRKTLKRKRCPSKMRSRGAEFGLIPPSPLKCDP